MKTMILGYVARKPDESESIENKIEDMSLQSTNDDKEICKTTTQNIQQILYYSS